MAVLEVELLKRLITGNNSDMEIFASHLIGGCSYRKK